MHAIVGAIKVENCGGWLLADIVPHRAASICGMQATPKACSVSACALQLTHKHMLATHNRIQVDACAPQASSQALFLVL